AITANPGWELRASNAALSASPSIIVVTTAAGTNPTPALETPFALVHAVVNPATNDGTQTHQKRRVRNGNFSFKTRNSTGAQKQNLIKYLNPAPQVSVCTSIKESGTIAPKTS